MRVPVRPLQGRWPAILERRAARFFWPDPRVILDPSPSPADFRTAMNAIAVGDTVKITAANRHPGADALLLEHVDVSDAVIVDIGASDGSTSADLIARLPGFRAYVIADLYLELSARRVGRRDVFFDADGTCVLVAGPRMLAWPARSRVVAQVYRHVVAAARRTSETRQVLLLNPEVRALMARDQRVSYAVHDIFTPWTGPRPNVIKVANVLGPYFPDDRIADAVTALLSSLPEGGHLLMVDNGRITGATPCGGLYRRAGDRFEAVAATDTAPVIDPIVRAVRLRSRVGGGSVGTGG